MTLTFQIFRNKKRLTKYLIDGNLKLSGFFIFEIKRAKMDEIFKDRFSVIGGPMDMIFDVLLETNVRLLKNIILQFFSKYSKSYNILNVKRCLKLKALSHNTGRVEAVKLHASNRTLQEPFRMPLIKSVVFVVFEILSSHFSMQNLLNKYNC